MKAWQSVEKSLAFGGAAVSGRVSVMGPEARPTGELQFGADSAIVFLSRGTFSLKTPTTARIPTWAGRPPAASLRQGQMINLHEFRAGLYSVPFSCGDELPECCFACVYLLSDATDACLCDSQFYFCGYRQADPDRPALPPGPPLVPVAAAGSFGPISPVAGSIAPGSGIKV